MNFQAFKKRGLQDTDVEQGELLGVPRRRVPLRNPYLRSNYADMEGTPPEILGAINAAMTPDAMAAAIQNADDQPGFGPGVRNRIRNIASVFARQGVSGQFYTDVGEFIKFVVLSIGEKAHFFLQTFLRNRAVAGAVYPLLTDNIIGAIPAIDADQTFADYFRNKINPLARFPVKLDGMVNGAIRLRGARQGLADYNPQKYMQSLYIKQDYLNSFPQWIGKNIKTATARRDQLDSQLAIQDELVNQNSAKMRRLAAVNPTIGWNAEVRRWVGPGVQLLQNSAQNKAAKLESQWKKGEALLTTSITPQQARVQIPQFVNQIVAANDNLSATGFGPISTSGSALYAGRWLDSVTGKMRVLPTANQKFLNPVSKQQKLGYLQAKIINHWNQAVSSYDQYNKLKHSSKDFGQTAARGIQNSLDMGNTQIQYVNFIYRTLMAHQANPDAPTARAALLRGVEPGAMRARFAALGQLPVKDDQANRTNAALQIAANNTILEWQNLIQRTQGQLRQQIQALPNQTERQQANYKLSKAYHSLVSFESRKLRGAFNKLLRLAVPKKINYQFINNGMERMSTLKSAANQVLNEPNPVGFSVENQRNLKDIGSNLASMIRNSSLTSRRAQQSAAELIQTFTNPNPVRTYENARYPTIRDITNRAFARRQMVAQ